MLYRSNLLLLRSALLLLDSQRSLHRQIAKMGRYENEGAYEDSIEALNKLLKQHPQLKPAAAKKIVELTTELSHEEKIPTEQEVKENGHNLSPLTKLKAGFLDFRKRFRTEPSLFSSLAESQHPKFMIIACADSRVDPAVVLGLDVGDAFTIRSVANLVPPYTKEGPLPYAGSAIEYAVLHLKVEHIVVIGHSRCGGIKALISAHDGSSGFSEHIEDWIGISKDAPKKAICSHADPEERLTRTIKESVNISLFNVLSFPYVKEGVALKTLTLHGAYYDFVTPAFEHWELDYQIGVSEKFE